MISRKVRDYIEQHPDIQKAIDQEVVGTDWSAYSRRVFESVARVINHQVSRRVVENPLLVSDLVIVGADELESTFFRHKLNSLEDFLGYLESRTSFRPFTWVSGKSLHAYWHGGRPKEKKYHVLLAFIEPDQDRWPAWKTERTQQPQDQGAGLLRKHFLGHYYRIYRKTDGSPNLIRAPFVIREDYTGSVIVETRTIGHDYRSTYAAIREGALYVDCENLSWNERESHIFNIGFESNPEMIFGVSNTLDKRKNAMALMNVLVRVPRPYDYSKVQAEEIPFASIRQDQGLLYLIMKFFERNAASTLVSYYIHSREELIRTTENSSSVR